MMRKVFFIAALAFLAGCAMIPPIAGVEGVSAVLTKKTVTDHIVSFSSGKNCSTIRVGRGQSYCVEDEVNVQPRVFCYRTLGSVSCYKNPDPYNGGQSAVGRDESNLVKKPIAPKPLFRRWLFEDKNESYLDQGS